MNNRELYHGFLSHSIDTRSQAFAYLLTVAARAKVILHNRAVCHAFLVKVGKSAIRQQICQSVDVREQAFATLRDRGMILTKHSRSGPPRAILLQMRSSSPTLTWKSRSILQRYSIMRLSDIVDAREGSGQELLLKNPPEQTSCRYHFHIISTTRVLNLSTNYEHERRTLVSAINSYVAWRKYLQSNKRT